MQDRFSRRKFTQLAAITLATPFLYACKGEDQTIEATPITSVPTPDSQVLSPQREDDQNQKRRDGKENPPDPENEHTGTWKLQGIDTMKLTKDRLCDQPTDDYIDHYVAQLKELGATHISLDVPLTDVTGKDKENVIFCNDEEIDSFPYLQTWIRAARSHDLNVIIRSPLMRYEGIYPNERKIPGMDYRDLIRTYYQKLGPYLKKGDVVLTAVEPGGYGIGEGQVFATNEEYNKWLSETWDIILSALGNKADELELGCCGFNGFELIGYDNPDWEEKVLNGEWQPIVNKESLQKFGNKIWIDHYPPVGRTMADFLDKLGKVYPNAEIYIGEYGNTNGMTPDELRAVFQELADNPQVKGVTYWHGGPGGKEELLTGNLERTENASVLQEFFTTDKSTS